MLSELQALSSTAARDEFFEEAKLRDLLVQRRITREGLTWQALPCAIQRELDSVRELYAAAAAVRLMLHYVQNLYYTVFEPTL